MGILRGGGVVVLVDRDKADVSDTKILLNIIADVDGVPPQTGKVFDNYAVYMTGFNIGEHLLEAGTVEVRSRSSVVDVGIVNSDLRVLFQKPGDNQLLCFNGCAAGMGIFYRKTDIDSSAASVIDFRCDNGNRFFSAFSCHTYASLMIADGTPLVVVSHNLGHAQVSTTSNIYSHVIASAEAQADRVFDRYADTVQSIKKEGEKTTA